MNNNNYQRWYNIFILRIDISSYKYFMFIIQVEKLDEKYRTINRKLGSTRGIQKYRILIQEKNCINYAIDCLEFFNLTIISWNSIRNYNLFQAFFFLRRYHVLYSFYCVIIKIGFHIGLS